MLNEFKDFIARGNVIDMAVGIVMGAAFTAIVNSAVGDILMPVIGWAMSGVDFSGYFLQLGGGDQVYTTVKAAKDAGVPVISYGVMINAIINFLAVSWFVFWIVKLSNKLKKAPPPAPAVTPEDIVLLREIRDALKK